MKKITIILPVVIIIFSTCQMKSKARTSEYSADSSAVGKVYNTNIDEIKKHQELQSRIEASENNAYAIYTYTVKDVEIALPVIAQGLKEQNFIALGHAEFNERIKEIFGDIFQSNNTKVKLRDKFNTIFVDTVNTENEFNYTIDNIFISKEYCFITYLPLIGDFVNLTDSNHYKIEINRPLISRNKYLFNNSQSDLAYLLAEDSAFLKTLVKSFGYTREPRINSLVMNDYLDLDDNHRCTVGEIIFIKNAAGALEIKQELLQWIAGHTKADDNALIQALFEYAFALYTNDNNDMYKNNPYKIFSLDEKRKIAAYICNIYEPLYYQWTPKNSRIWPAATLLDNLLVKDEGLAAYLKQHQYFQLPALKQQLE